MIDVISQIKLAAFKGQRHTRQTQKHTIHMLIFVCMKTKYTSFVLLIVLRSNYMNHGNNEKIVRAVKNGIEKSDLSTSRMDAVSFNNFLENFFAQLNITPIYSKVVATQTSYFSNIVTKHISPSILTG